MDMTRSLIKGALHALKNGDREVCLEILEALAAGDVVPRLEAVVAGVTDSPTRLEHVARMSAEDRDWQPDPPHPGGRT